MPALNIDFANLPVFWQWVVYVSIALTAVLAIIGFVRKVWPIITQFVETINSLAGLPKFIERTDATLAAQDQTLATQATKIEDIHHEVHYNNGSSVKDAVARMEQNQVEIRKGIEGLYKRADASDLKAAELRTDLELTKPPARKRAPRTPKMKESL